MAGAERRYEQSYPTEANRPSVAHEAAMAVELQERFYETQRAQLLRWMPWLHLFRAFRIALDPRKIVLGALAAFVLTAGDRAIDALPFSPVSARDVQPVLSG